jgi:hypothetical protein
VTIVLNILKSIPQCLWQYHGYELWRNYGMIERVRRILVDFHVVQLHIIDVWSVITEVKYFNWVIWSQYEVLEVPLLMHRAVVVGMEVYFN